MKHIHNAQILKEENDRFEPFDGLEYMLAVGITIVLCIAIFLVAAWGFGLTGTQATAVTIVSGFVIAPLCQRFIRR